MKKSILLILFLFFAAALHGAAYLGYLYPAGGERGTTVRVIAGGQGIRENAVLICSNPGVKLKSATAVPNMGYFPWAQRNWLIKYLRSIYAGKTEKPPYPENKDEQGWRKNSWLDDIEKLPLLERSIVAHSIYVRPNALQAAPSIARRVILELEIAPDAPVGPCRIRLVSGRNISNEKLFFIDAAKHVIEQPYYPPFAKAPELMPVKTFPAILNGQIMPGETDLFPIFLESEKEYSFTMRAAELSPYLGDAVPGHFQGILTLRDSDGREVAFADDEYHHPDPVLRYTPEISGVYMLHVSDSIKRGRADFVYRIEAVRGRVPFRPYRNVSDYVKRHNSFGIGSMHRVEVLKNDVDIHGTMNYGNADRRKTVFVINAKKGERLIFEVFAARIDSPLDSVLVVRDSENKIIAENDDSPMAIDLDINRRQTDSKIDVTFPADGKFFVELSSRNTLNSADGFYILQIRPPEPSPMVISGASVLDISPKTGIGKMRFYVHRKDGFAGDIVITSPQLAAVGKAVISGKQNSAEISFKLANPPRKQRTMQLEIFAEYTVDGQKKRIPVIPADETMQAFAYTHLLAAENFYSPVIRAPAPKKKPPKAAKKANQKSPAVKKK